MNRTYAIADYTAIQAAAAAETLDLELLFSTVVETDPASLRLSLDGTQCILKTYDAPVRSDLGGLTPLAYLRARAAELSITYTEYPDLDDLRTVLAGTEWTPAEE